MQFNSWGNYPKIESKLLNFLKFNELKKTVIKTTDFIAAGNGRSYGDSALNSTVLSCKKFNHFLSFNKRTGALKVQSGVLLSDIIEAFVPRGWFLQVVPGTKLITVGGAIASDVHGKNHHHAGCFSESVISFNLLLTDGKKVNCSKTKNVELFRASCGGMGLTGVICDVTLKLKKINSKNLIQTTTKANNLKEIFAAFETKKDTTYSVAWIDCLAKGKNQGRSLLMSGEFCDDGDLKYQPKTKFSIPFYFPSWALNSITVKIFNILYYLKSSIGSDEQIVSLDSFFFPLDALSDWNKIYGKQGFLQYQIIFPKHCSYDALKEMLDLISQSGKGSFLAVLKLYGPENDNFLSFPMEGYSLALDFKVEPDVFGLLDQLDSIVTQYSGRIYLAKDARVSKQVFEKGYPSVGQFRELRNKYKMNEKFNSLQSKRVEI